MFQNLKLLNLQFAGPLLKLRSSSTAARLKEKYKVAKEALQALQRPPTVNSKAVFANNELPLGTIVAYGFDYDYTLAVYKKVVNSLIYDLALGVLIEDYKYPAGIADVPHDPTFAVRGLHYDIQRGVLLKLDAFCQIQLGTVYRGKQKLSDEEVKRLYNGTYIPQDLVDPRFKNGSAMKHLMDFFSLPELGLLANVTEYFQQNGIQYDAQSLFQDVQTVVRSVHITGVLYKAVLENISRYVTPSPKLRTYFERLQDAKKVIFLVTNSPYNFVPFRIYNEMTDRLSWEKVVDVRKGVVYAEGNLQELLDKSPLHGKEVLYFGDHVYSDLAEPMLKLGWRTGAIIPEIEREVQIINSDTFRAALGWLQTLTTLLETNQICRTADADAAAVMAEWHAEWADLRKETKALFNPQFGSVFRTFHNPTYFSRRLMRLADVYTSSLPNFLQYSLDHTFYPRRTPLPHELYFPVPYEAYL